MDSYKITRNLFDAIISNTDHIDNFSAFDILQIEHDQQRNSKWHH